MKNIFATIRSPGGKVSVAIRSPKAVRVSRETTQDRAATDIRFRDGDIAEESLEYQIEDWTFNNPLSLWLMKRDMTSDGYRITTYNTLGELRHHLGEP